MNRWEKPLLVNVVIIAVIMLLNLWLATPENTNPLPHFAATGLLIIFILAPANFIFGIVRNRKRKGDGPVYFLISGLLLLVGFSVCTLPF